MEIRFDGHMHGPIGLQKYWLEAQEYAGKNPLQLIADEAFLKNINISAVTSQKEEIPRLSVDDRLGILIKHELPLLPKEYKAGTLGGKDNILVVEKENKKVYLVNGQTVMTEENGKKYDLLVVGSNEVPNGRTFEDTLKYGQDRGLILIAEHPYVETHRGMGKKLLEKYIGEFDAIEGFNSQAIFPNWMTKLPKVGAMFSRAGKKLNQKAKESARYFHQPYIATSDAHRIEDLGISYISWIGELDNSSEDKFLTELKDKIGSGNFKTTENDESMIDWFRWISIFKKGIASGKVVDEYIPSNQF